MNVPDEPLAAAAHSPKESAQAPSRDKRVALALGGGGACGLAHIGVLEVLERERVAIDCIIGTSMGGVVGALSASGLRAHQMYDLARGFRFPRGVVLGRVVAWDSIFRPAAELLTDVTFEGLNTRLMLTATNLETGDQIVLRRDALLPSLRATCAVPGILPIVKIGGRWLVDGGLVNLLPVDVAWMSHPDVVIAVNVGATRPRPLPALEWPISPFLMRIGRFIPNPATAKLCFEILARAADITTSHQAALATAMTGPELLIEPRLPGIGVRDFHRLDDAVEAGRRAAYGALPQLRRLLDAPVSERAGLRAASHSDLDPVCGMVINEARARASSTDGGRVYHFCSPNCRDLFERNPARYRPQFRREDEHG